jgi:hypothetical protein
MVSPKLRFTGRAVTLDNDDGIESPLDVAITSVRRALEA